MIRVLLGSWLLMLSVRAFAQSDSLTISDTIGVYTERGGRQYTGNGYTYYGANQLAGSQLQAILNRSPDLTSRTLTRQSRHLSWVSTGLVISSLGFFIESFPTGGQRYRSNGTLLVAGYGALFGSLIPQSLSTRRLARAIASHNTYLRARPAEYVPPVVYARADRKWSLTAADTIAIRRTGLTYTYQYRGVPVQPGRQLGLLTTSLNDRDVNEGIRYIRTLNRIGGVVGGIGQGLLTGYVVGRLLTRRYRRTTALDTELLTTSLFCIGANFVLTRHTNRAQRRWLVRYNDRLKQQAPLP